MRLSKMTCKKKCQILGVLSIFLIVISCGTSKIPKGDLLYTGAEIKVKGDSITRKEKKNIKSVLKNKVRPIPNKSFLGLRPGVFFYNLIGEESKKSKGIRHWLQKKLGEKPVFFSQVDMAHNAEVLQSHLQNIGYFNAVVSTEPIRDEKTAKMIYTVTPKNIFRVNSVDYQVTKSPLGQAIDTLLHTSHIKKGEPFTLNAIISERERIDSNLKEKGYYYFNPDYLIAVVDSTLADSKVDVKLKVKEEVAPKALKPYRINQIYINPSYNLNEELAINKDTLAVGDIRIIDLKSRFNPSIFKSSVFFKKGDLYNRTNHNLTLNRLISLGVFKFVKNEFKVSPEGENLLDAYYYLTPNETKSIYLETSVKTNSAGYYGSELSLNWSHNNIFKGAEKLGLKFFGGLDFQLSGSDEGFNIYQAGMEVNLLFPRFITPFKRLNTSGHFPPKTKATLGYSYLLRQKLYGLHSFKASFGYLWKENIRKEHNLSILDVNYVRSENVTDLYENEIKRNPFLAKVVEKQLIFGPTYSYTYTNRMLKKSIQMYYSGSVDFSGNLTGLVWGANAKASKIRKIGDVAFSQYAKTEQEIRFYFNFGENSEIATRFVGGIAYPYGNSITVPYSKQFYAGGSGSIRAFRSRSLGPGATPKNVGASFLYDRSGDIKLEANLEYRTKLFSVVNGALFVDAGNIWLLENTDEFPKGKFTKNFLQDIAVGVGAGIRIDLSFLVLRFDGAFPLRNPSLNSPWVFKNVNLASKNWRSENLILNIAIGYPF